MSRFAELRLAGEWRNRPWRTNDTLFSIVSLLLITASTIIWSYVAILKFEEANRSSEPLPFRGSETIPLVSDKASGGSAIQRNSLTPGGPISVGGMQTYDLNLPTLDMKLQQLLQMDASTFPKSRNRLRNALHRNRGMSHVRQNSKKRFPVNRSVNASEISDVGLSCIQNKLEAPRGAPAVGDQARRPPFSRRPMRG